MSAASSSILMPPRPVKSRHVKSRHVKSSSVIHNPAIIDYGMHAARGPHAAIRLDASPRLATPRHATPQALHGVCTTIAPVCLPSLCAELAALLMDDLEMLDAADGGAARAKAAAVRGKRLGVSYDRTESTRLPAMRSRRQSPLDTRDGSIALVGCTHGVSASLAVCSSRSRCARLADAAGVCENCSRCGGRPTLQRGRSRRAAAVSRWVESRRCAWTPPSRPPLDPAVVNRVVG